MDVALSVAVAAIEVGPDVDVLRAVEATGDELSAALTDTEVDETDDG